jgi:hypothetical protein
MWDPLPQPSLQRPDCKLQGLRGEKIYLTSSLKHKICHDKSALKASGSQAAQRAFGVEAEKRL